MGAVGKKSVLKALASADMVSCVSVERETYWKFTASSEMTQHYSAYESFTGSLPSPLLVVVSVLKAADELPEIYVSCW